MSGIDSIDMSIPDTQPGSLVLEGGGKSSTISTVLQCVTLKKYLSERYEVAYHQRNNFSDILMDLTSMRKK